MAKATGMEPVLLSGSKMMNESLRGFEMANEPSAKDRAVAMLRFITPLGLESVPPQFILPEPLREKIRPSIPEPMLIEEISETPPMRLLPWSVYVRPPRTGS
jgi:hypothetical protein